jgi:uncharacterized membrane protein YhaH (DUF805 family)
MFGYPERTNRVSYLAYLAIFVASLFVIRLFDAKYSLSEALIIGIAIPRLHDLGRSGWWAVVAFVFELAGVIGAFVFLPFASARVMVGIIVVVLFVLATVLGFIPGQRVENRFGPPPGPGVAWRRRPR